MRLSNWDGAYPIMVNPTVEEIVEIAATSWDTLRICFEDDKFFAVASGYGNTHSSVMSAVRTLKEYRRELGRRLIVYRHGNQYLANLEDIGGSRKAPIDKLEKIMPANYYAIIRDIVNLTEQV